MGIPAAAIPVEFSAFDGSRSAWASFEMDGGNLVVTLANTSESGRRGSDDVLTGMFFDSGIDLNLQLLSGVASNGASVASDWTVLDTGVDEWDHETHAYGILAGSGFHDRFSDLSFDGVLSSPGTSGLIQDQLVFTFIGVPAGFQPGLHVKGVFFQYGTGLLEAGGGPMILAIPEPGMLAFFAVSGLALVLRHKVS
ncbi:MAG TPA: hypothetical protein PL151_00415 [Phycisphaerae bacterium]|nr:hypothetical protein [Phycisphaerae bacterium]HOJ73278.1 hypothetical protein [Phycisphaerae bacterium]HOM51156.1 hypothetical protein [Phycisphaerae bacterium]HON66618.1 hypothetical protein [Phycisphaerae bacterium]HOQ84497.1 hypothetical protein [Phycisphaerae bacterium]